MVTMNILPLDPNIISLDPKIHPGDKIVPLLGMAHITFLAVP